MHPDPHRSPSCLNHAQAFGVTSDAHRHGAKPQDRPSVLLVEDDFLVRWVTATCLQEMHFDVFEAADAHEAVAILSAGSLVHLVLTDVNMTPDMSGHDLATWIAEHFPSLPVLLTSANPVEATRSERSSIRHFLAKPYDLSKLQHVMASLIDPLS